MAANDTLFTKNPALSRQNLIQYNPTLLTSHLVAIGYADAARRLRTSFTGQPWDDVMLLPFLFVWRQAIEIMLKIDVKDLARLRRLGGDKSPDLESAAVDKRLRSPQLVGHNLDKLTAELVDHCTKLGLEALPADTLETLKLLAALDNGGTGFRYAGVLTVPGADIDFNGVADALDKTFRLLEVVIDAATNGEGVPAS